MVAESWLRSLWRTQRKNEGSPLVGVLTFEVANLMSKLAHLWKSLSDKQVASLRKEIMNSLGIRKLVSDDDEYIAGLICAEMIENLEHVAKAVARLSMKCTDSTFRSFENAFGDLIKVGADSYGWQLTWRKMDKKVKKMERFIIVNANLHQELETLVELEHTLRRMRANDDSDCISLLEYEKKVAWKKQEVKQLKEMSLWNRTHDYVVCLLARSLFTIFNRIAHVFGTNYVANPDIKDSEILNIDYIDRSHSVSAMMRSSIHPSEAGIPRFSSGPMEKWITKSGPIPEATKMNFYSGPLGNTVTKPGPDSTKKRSMAFYSGPLWKSTTKSGPLPRTNKSGLRLWQSRDFLYLRQDKSSKSKPNGLLPVGPFKGCMMGGGNNSPVANCIIASSTLDGTDRNLHTSGNLRQSNQAVATPKRRFLNAPPETLGAAALALHYANVIIVIEKLAAFPHLIGHDARDDLYNMFPATVRAALREKLKPYAKSSVCNNALAQEWSEAISGILEWLAPLAHNMIRWQSERSFEHQNLVSRTNVLLVQTLYFANQEKTEAIITELLVGLNYVWRLGRELNAKALVECASDRMLRDSLNLEGL